MLNAKASTFIHLCGILKSQEPIICHLAFSAQSTFVQHSSVVLFVIDCGFMTILLCYNGCFNMCVYIQIPLPSAQLHVPVVTSGYLDAIAMYFDLHLDPTISISTSPHSNEINSWEQAIFPTAMREREGGKRSTVWAERGDILHLIATCSDTLLRVNIEKIERGENYQEEMETCSNATTEQPVSGSPIHFVDRGALRRLNDETYFTVYSSAISHALEELRAEDSESEGESGSSVDSRDIGSDLHSSATGNTANGTGGGMELRRGEAQLSCDEVLESENENEPESDEEDIANCIALDMSHELSILGIIAAKIGTHTLYINSIYTL